MFQEGDALKKLYLLKLFHLLPFSSANTGRILLFVALPTGKRPELKKDLWKKFLKLEISLHGSYYNRPTTYIKN
jgi:hypothetical protein